MVEERIRDLDDRTIEIIKYEEQMDNDLAFAERAF